MMYMIVYYVKWKLNCGLWVESNPVIWGFIYLSNMRWLSFAWWSWEACEIEGWFLCSSVLLF